MRGRALHCTAFRRVSLHGSLEGTVSLFMKCPLGPLAGSSMSESHQAGPQSPPPPERHCRAVVFEGLQEPQVFPPALFPLEVARPAPCISRRSGIWVGSWRKMRAWGGEASPRPRRDLPPPPWR